MKKTLFFISLLGFLVSSCAFYNSNIGYGGQPTGVVYANYRTAGNIANPTVRANKMGESCSMGVLWLVAWGTSGTDDAMKAGGVNKISNVQYSTLSVLSGLYSQYCTIVAGE